MSTFAERVEKDRLGLNYGIYFRSTRGEAVCIVAVCGKASCEEIFERGNFELLGYFIGPIGDTK